MLGPGPCENKVPGSRRAKLFLYRTGRFLSGQFKRLTDLCRLPWLSICKYIHKRLIAIIVKRLPGSVSNVSLPMSKAPRRELRLERLRLAFWAGLCQVWTLPGSFHVLPCRHPLHWPPNPPHHRGSGRASFLICSRNWKSSSSPWPKPPWHWPRRPGMRSCNEAHEVQ